MLDLLGQSGIRNMVTIKTNINQVLEGIGDKLEKLSNPEYLFRPVCFGLIDLMTRRIHEDGEDSSGNQIGMYSTPYLKKREKRGRKEGPKVVVSFERQLEQSWTVEATPKGYGVGFLNIFNFNKSQWVEATYKKPIFKPQQKELDYAIDYINELANQALSE